MKRTRLVYWLAAACLTWVAGCAPEGVATEGSLLITVPVPAPEEPFVNIDAIDFGVFCDASGDAMPIESGELEISGEDVTETGGTVLLWQAFVEGLPPGDCTVRLVTSGRFSCSATEPVSILAGEVTEPTLVLICLT